MKGKATMQSNGEPMRVIYQTREKKPSLAINRSPFDANPWCTMTQMFYIHHFVCELANKAKSSFAVLHARNTAILTGAYLAGSHRHRGGIFTWHNIKYYARLPSLSRQSPISRRNKWKYFLFPHLGSINIIWCNDFTNQ